MTARQERLTCASRLAASIFCWLTSGFALLSASPFTYQEFIRPKLLGSGGFSDWHRVVFWAWLVAALLSIRHGFRARSAARWLSIAFAASWAVVGLWIWRTPLLPRLVDGDTSLVVGLLALSPILWLGAVDLMSGSNSLERPAAAESNDDRLLLAAALSAMLLAVLGALSTAVATIGRFEPDLMTEGLALGLFRNAIDHLVLFCSLFLVLAIANRTARHLRFGWACALVFAVVSAILAVAAQRLIGQPLGFSGIRAAVVAATYGTTIAATWVSARLSRWRGLDQSLRSPLDLFLGSPNAVQPSLVRLLAGCLLIALVIHGLPVFSRILDWDFTILSAGVFVVWGFTFDLMFRSAPSRVRAGHPVVAAACLMPLAAFNLTGASRPHALDRYMVYNAPFRVAEGLLRSDAGGTPAFDRFLREHTGLGDVGIRSRSLDLVTDLRAAAPGRAPLIFVFVVDSLRQDYLSPYNPAVSFTPRIAEFAADSLVFRNAFTRYGGTGLSLPAIWTGAVGVHKQYVQPFWPMNTLEKLLDANRYRRVMSVDVIMEQLLRQRAQDVELDRGRGTTDYRFCQTLDELQRSLRSLPSDGRPTFSYTLPQDLHVANIISATVPEGETYPGFHAPYAARVHHLDGCFGQFVDFLKAEHLYDRSLIVLTSDHGEMLGEEGWWGHVYYLFPQVIRIPLIIHLPPALADRSAVDLDAVALSTDITPTLYAALGYQPVRESPLVGRPLIGESPADKQARRREPVVVAASYSAVYGVVADNGQRVYIVDAVQRREYAYVRPSPLEWRRVEVSNVMRDESQRVIREHLYEVDRMYGTPDGK